MKDKDKNCINMKEFYVGLKKVRSGIVRDTQNKRNLRTFEKSDCLKILDFRYEAMQEKEISA